jgi:signal peptidase I
MEKVSNKKSRMREYTEALVIAILLALFIRTFVVQAFKIPSGSMIPTLDIGDHILVNKFIYGTKVPFTDKIAIPFKTPRRGDIIVFKYPEDEQKDFIKRVIGLPGDTLEVRNKMIYVNGKPLVESYAFFSDPNTIPMGIQPRDNLEPVTIPKDSFFVMGDNRDHSLDSRYWGFVSLNKIKGRAFVIYWSWDGENHGVRWNRFGKWIQ